MGASAVDKSEPATERRRHAAAKRPRASPRRWRSGSQDATACGAPIDEASCRTRQRIPLRAGQFALVRRVMRTLICLARHGWVIHRPSPELITSPTLLVGQCSDTKTATVNG